MNYNGIAFPISVLSTWLMLFGLSMAVYVGYLFLENSGHIINKAVIFKFVLMCRDLLKITVFFLPLLGVTWIFGILAVNEEPTVFEWIFAVFNVLLVCSCS